MKKEKNFIIVILGTIKTIYFAGTEDGLNVAWTGMKDKATKFTSAKAVRNARRSIGGNCIIKTASY